jgi:hypothetical protein
LARLLPKQNNSGSRAVQIGRAGGNVKVVHLTQHIYGQARQHPIKVTRPDRRTKQRASLAEQHLVLGLLDQVPDRVAVLDFMANEFGTRMVIDLDAHELFRLRRYIEVILNREK